MPNSSTSSIIGWTLSFVIYFIVIILCAYMIQSNYTKNIKYTASKKNLLNVTLVERKTTKQTVQKKKKIVKNKTTVNQEKPKAVKKTVRAKKSVTKPDLSKLFGKINVEKLPEETQKREQKVRKKIVKSEVEEVEKVDKAKKITKSLDFAEQENLIITQKDGIYDEFRGKITDILDSNWQETVNTVSGNEAEVVIGIDKFGNFSYKIETLSYNDAFNAKLRDFLEEMKDIVFPVFQEGEIFYMKTKFKDILE